MSFSEQQRKLLSGKLSAKAVKTRDHDGKQLSYIEGWYAIAEANRLFGFDGWDRETISAACVWEDGRRDPKACAYAVRVRIHVRAGDTLVLRDGSGVGHGVAKTMGEAHESALKEAETDATKRALTTFGNLFGLALYDKKRAGVRGGTKPRISPEASALRFMAPDGAVSVHDRPQSFCTAIRGALERAASLPEISRLWERNSDTLMRLRTLWPALRTPQGMHYADVIAALHRRQLAKLNAITATPAREIPPAEIEPVPAMPRRLRDPAHLRLVAELPCIVCGRAPSQAHHLLFAQPRAMARKVSDEWTLPLCSLHHRALHDAGNEERWWEEHRIDAKTEAGALWQRSRDERAGQAAISTVAGDHAGAVVAVSPNDRVENRRNMIGDAVVEAE